MVQIVPSGPRPLVTAGTGAAATVAPFLRLRFRPRPRNTELLLLIVGSLTLLMGAVSLGATERYLAAQAKGVRLAALGFGPADPFGIGLYLGALFAAHAVLVLAGRRLDQILLPAAGLLGGIGLLRFFFSI